MAKQTTEMRKRTLEGIVLASLATELAQGNEITPRLRDEGLADIVEGTGYALLVRVEQRGLIDATRAPPRGVRRRRAYWLNASAATASTSYGNPEASWPGGSNACTTTSNTRKDNECIHGRKVDGPPHRVARPEEAVQSRQGANRGTTRTVRHLREDDAPVLHSPVLQSRFGRV
ncbi:PadR family transcriptional regulator [Rathayibacter soli]|uniref:PadR family transcriptional regulator n=1 Tax=Rathayibacter soli TaxID=3144168 RepID=UPI003907ED7F